MKVNLKGGDVEQSVLDAMVHREIAPGIVLLHPPQWYNFPYREPQKGAQLEMFYGEWRALAAVNGYGLCVISVHLTKEVSE